jgi:PAS domain S-box-containing protein
MGTAASIIENEELPKKFEALLSNIGVKEAFDKFLDSDVWKCSVTEYQKMITVDATVVDDKTVEEVLKSYIFPISDESLNAMILKQQKSTGEISQVVDLEMLKGFSRARIFPLFLTSPEYQTWVDSQLDAPVDTLPPDYSTSAQLSSPELKGGDDTRENRLDFIFKPSEHVLSQVMEESMASVDKMEIEDILRRNCTDDNWVVDVLLAVENLPFCVSIASARQSRKGFPLIYVNKAFEVSTGYERHEIVGHNCRFLQSDNTQPEQIKLMSERLRNAEPVKVAIENRRKDGTPFLNLLSMKPVFDSDGSYAYVIGVQYDFSQTPIISLATDIKMVDDILSILPNII